MVGQLLHRQLHTALNEFAVGFQVLLGGVHCVRELNHAGLEGDATNVHFVDLDAFVEQSHHVNGGFYDEHGLHAGVLRVVVHAASLSDVQDVGLHASRRDLQQQGLAQLIVCRIIGCRDEGLRCDMRNPGACHLTVNQAGVDAGEDSVHGAAGNLLSSRNLDHCLGLCGLRLGGLGGCGLVCLLEGANTLSACLVRLSDQGLEGCVARPAPEMTSISIGTLTPETTSTPSRVAANCAPAL